MPQNIEHIITPEILFHLELFPWMDVWTDLRQFLAQRWFLLAVYKRGFGVYTLADSLYLDS